MDTPEVGSHSLHRRSRPHPEWLEYARNITGLAPHLGAGSVHQQALDSLNAALFAIDADGGLICTNRAGDEMLRARRWVQLNGRVLRSGRMVREHQDFGGALAALCRGVGRTSLLTSRIGAREVLMCTMPIRAAEPASSSCAGFVWLIATAPWAALDHFARAFDLTKAEARLLGYLVAGLDLRSAAGEMQVSIHTVRNQLKAVFRKTGRHSQPQLLTLFGRLGALRANA